MALLPLSGTYLFGGNTEAMDVLIEAWERCGRKAGEISGDDIDTAVRSAMYMFSDWGNSPINLWAVSALQTQALTQGQQSFNLTPQDLFVIQAATRTTDSSGVNTDLVITPMSRAEYLALPNKAQQSTRPTQFYVQRTITPTVYLWPTPDSSSYSIIFYTQQQVQDIGALTNGIDAPQRWFEAIAAGIAMRLAEKWSPDRYDKLSMRALAAFNAATAEDTEDVPMRIVPDVLGRRL